MSDYWSRHQLASRWVRWDEPGDSITGKVVELRDGQGYKGDSVPELLLDTVDGEKILTAGQVDLRKGLSAAQPEVGDEITIRFTGYGQAKGGQNPPKHFAVWRNEVLEYALDESYWKQ
jgi:hypothetical protein